MGNIVKAADLHRILSDVKPFTSKDATIPALCTVQIETRDGSIVAVATDRFTLGISRADYSGEDFSVVIPVTAIDNILRIAKTLRRDEQCRTVNIEADGGNINFTFATGESLSIKCSTEQFPKWRQLIPVGGWDNEAEGDAMVGYNTAYLARFSKVSGVGMKLFSRGRSKPSIVTIGTDFVGLIMPWRTEDGAFVKPTWIS